MSNTLLCLVFLSLTLQISGIKHVIAQKKSREELNFTSLSYQPVGDAIIKENGIRWNNRPLYCEERKAVIMAGEQPLLYSQLGKLVWAVSDGKTTMFLHQFAQRLMSYRPGQIEWAFSDPKFQGTKVILRVTTLPGSTGYVARLSLEGAQSGYSAVWCIVPPSLEKKRSYHFLQNGAGFKFVPDSIVPFSNIEGKFSQDVEKWEITDIKNLDPTPKVNNNLTGWYNEGAESTNPANQLTLKETQPLLSEALNSMGVIAWIPIKLGIAQTLAVVGDDNDNILIKRQKRLDATLIENPAMAFEKGIVRAESLAKRVVVNTPDIYLNAAVGASVVAVNGLFVDPCFVHGGSAWRQQQPGWRMMGGATVYGWHDQVYRALKYWDTQMIKEDNGKTGPALSITGCQQEETKSRVFGKGFIDYHQTLHYEFQTQFFDEAVREWRATADPRFEKLLMPLLELHLDRCRICYDPDGDGLYESYINTWPTDSQWYNGGGTVEQSCYMYYGFQALAEMKRRAGNQAQAIKCEAECAKIKTALNKILWLPQKGQFASYIEQGGYKRVHSDAWIYSEHLPIEAGLSTPMQAWQAMYYTEWAMERFKFPYGGEMRQTSNWVPGQWSIRELFHGDNFAIALGYFLSGQGEDGWQLLSGTMKESMFGDLSKKSGYSSEAFLFNRTNIPSPGGLSHPNCGIDFNDITTMFSRAVVEGLFGYQPDYPKGKVIFTPAFPSEWDHASISSPDFNLSYKASDNLDTYELTLKKAAKLQLRLPIRANRINRLLVNSKPFKYSIVPWTGYGQLMLEIPSTRKAVVEIQMEGRMKQADPDELIKEVGEQIVLRSHQGDFSKIEDPQKILKDVRIVGKKLSATCADNPGHHLFFAEVGGNIPYYQVVKLQVKNTALEKATADKMPKVAPQNGHWKTIDLSQQFNGDIRTIYQQKYLTPRPNTASARIGYDGWSAWTFRWWKFPVPEIKLDGISKLTNADGLLVTPQNVRFKVLSNDKNIAFTSLWDNWPKSVNIPVNLKGDEVWLLVCGSTNPMQLRIANAVIRFRYADGKEEKLELNPPSNFWSLCRFGQTDYNYQRDGFSLPKIPPAQVPLGENCRAMVYGWKLRPGLELKSVMLQTLSQEVVIGLMGISVWNSK